MTPYVFLNLSLFLIASGACAFLAMGVRDRLRGGAWPSGAPR